eukprot:Anaeramoba_ignava/c1991_g1_i1.p2 GENE.c1991_g1_i1~~c1991_g1_i1.p2  ORF type:complete len:146 (+),score=61.05 c1991_g1_i1:36-473(+)
MSYIEYKLVSENRADRIILDERTSITLGELKRAILAKFGGGSSQNTDIQISNAQSGQEYLDDQESIPRNSSVWVKRIPLKINYFPDKTHKVIKTDGKEEKKETENEKTKETTNGEESKTNEKKQQQQQQSNQDFMKEKHVDGDMI